MGFQHGLSGLNAATTNLDVIGNNIANSGTVGFKQSQAQFSSVMANAVAGGGGENQIGIGTKVSDIAQQFTQGNITATSNPLDIAINGNGFFRMDNDGVTSYSRAGQFHVDQNGFVVNSEDINLTGFLPDATGTIIATNPTSLQLPTTDLAPRATTQFENGLNLDSRAVVPAVPVTFDSTDPTTYESSTSGTVFDSLGNPHIFTLFFQKTGINAWDVSATVDGSVDPATGLSDTVALGGGAVGAPLPITFDSQGAFVAAAALPDVNVTLANGAVTTLDFSMNLNDSTQYGSNFSVNALSQDGFASGSIAGFDVTADGVINGNFTNGESKVLGQIVLANFKNSQGLISMGQNQWVESIASGQPLVGVPRTGLLGALQSAAVEDSNVDLTAELVNMITAQRSYQANAKTIETQDAIMQTLINL